MQGKKNIIQEKPPSKTPCNAVSLIIFLFSLITFRPVSFLYFHPVFFNFFPPLRALFHCIYLVLLQNARRLNRGTYAYIRGELTWTGVIMPAQWLAWLRGRLTAVYNGPSVRVKRARVAKGVKRYLEEKCGWPPGVGGGLMKEEEKNAQWVFFSSNSLEVKIDTTRAQKKTYQGTTTPPISPLIPSP